MGLLWFVILLLCELLLMASGSRELTPASSNNSGVVGLMGFVESCVRSDPNGFLSDWSFSSSSPCSWRGVSCSGDGLVTAVNLTGGGITGILRLSDLAADIPSLTVLNLRGNKFASGDLSVSGECNLQAVDFSANNLTDPLPVRSSFMESCERLDYVNLSRNFIPGGNLRFGSSLTALDLSRNRFSDSGILSYSLSNCRSLKFLNFSDNKLAGKMETGPSSDCENLAVVDLSYNLLSGEIPPSFLSTSPASIRQIDLSHNNFSGKFSDLDFQSCGNLTILNLSRNSLSGYDFPASLRNCELLESLDLSRNELKNTISGELLGSFRKLKKLSLAHNRFVGSIPAELGNACGTLQELDLSMNNLSGGLPVTFAACLSLRTLNLGSNQLSGDFLISVISKLPSLMYLYAPFNNITGFLPLSLINCTRLRVLDLSSNRFTGNIPAGFCSSTSLALEKILLANNFLQGTVPLELGDCKSLRSIDLSFNRLTGSIPKQIWTLPNLSDLVIWANNLTGSIPEGICVNGGNLETLILNNNFLTGSIPESISHCTNMIWVSLSSNRLIGTIPAGIGNLRNLAILQLGNNSLTGSIPRELGECESLIWLDLNSNNLTGAIPSELADQAGLVIPGAVSGKQFAFVRNEGGTSCRGAGGLVEFEGVRSDTLADFPMVHSCPSTRIYTGMTVYTFTSNGSMIYLDLSYNALSGTIPHRLGTLAYMQVLNLGHNSLTGNIPDAFGELKVVGVLDLSHNDLQGYLPGSLATLTFLSDLDVSNNNLTGPIPTGGQLTTFPSSRYENNSYLCGLPLPPCGASPRSRPGRFRTRDRRQVETGVFVGVTFFVLSILGLTIALYRAKKAQKKDEQREKYIESLPTSGSSSWKLSVPEPLSINVSTFEKPLRKLTFAHLLEATNGFSSESLIGSGGFGEVYKAQLKDGCIVAIKKLIYVTGQGDREFMAEMETIGKIKHRNLVPLLGYCKIGEERLLVYEYMKYGSLETVLHENASLDWPARKKIAIGSARGLAFLHHSCIPHIIHRDMKSSNVLLDENFEARVSDFGMARLVNALDSHLSVSTLAGTPGYVPPEYYQSFRCTTKGDVYSYGVILLELLSGKKPIDPCEFGDDNNLVGWAKQLHREKRVSEILDGELMSRGPGEAELYQYLRIAFECLDDRPFKRPTMIQVMAMFKELQVDSENDFLDGFSLKDATIDESREKEH